MTTLIAIIGIGIFCLLAEIMNLKKIIIPVSIVSLMALFGLNITGQLPEITGYESMIEVNKFIFVGWLDRKTPTLTGWNKNC